MLTVKLFLKALFTGKIKIITFFTIITFCIGTVLSACNTCAMLSKILTDVGVSFLAAILVTAFEAIKGERAALLINLFCIRVDKKIAIVIPEFATGHILLDESQPEKKIPLSEIPSLSKTDSMAAFQFQALLNNHNIGNPEILTDREALAILHDDAQLAAYSTFFSVGLSSNKFSSYVVTTPSLADKIKLDNNSTIEPGNKIIQVKENDGQLHSYKPAAIKASDFACFLKAEITSATKPTYHVVICGGLNATGTKKLATYISQNWEEMRTIKIENTPIHKLKNCLLLFKINGKENVRLDNDALLVPHPYIVQKY